MKIFIAILATLFIAALAQPVSAAILFEHRAQQQVARGVTYERNRMMTEYGMLDVHVLIIDLTDPHLHIGPVASDRMGFRETTTSLLSQAGAVAGINADFFGLAGAYSVTFGPMASEGTLHALNASNNTMYNQFATFFLDEHNFPFMRYMRSHIHFYNNGHRHVDIGSFNNIGHDLQWPALINRQAMADTAMLNARFPGLVFVVVEGNTITHVSAPGETVRVPYNGYVLIIPARMSASYRPLFQVGEHAEVILSNSLDINFNQINAAIGGGGLILYDGQTVHDDGTAIAGRHPRSAIGISACREQLILMTVDGRTHSIGVTHDELADLLRHYDAVEAMHLDGGGSSTLVANNRVMNGIPGGAQRRVINALGVFDRAPIGTMSGLGMTFEQPRVFVGAPVAAVVFGEDDYWNRIALPPYTATMTAVPEAGRWLGQTFTPARAGAHLLTATYRDFVAESVLYAVEIAELRAHPANINTFEGANTRITFSGVGMDGTTIPATNVAQVRVVPTYLGTFENNEFIAANYGTGYLVATIDGVNTYVGIRVSGNPRLINTAAANVSFSGYPQFVGGSASRIQAYGRTLYRLTYEISADSTTQAAHMVFDPPLALPANPVAVSMLVFGDGSGHWLRGSVTDGAGRQHTIDFSRSLNYIGAQHVTAMLPTGAVGPFTLDRVWMVSLGAEMESSHIIHIERFEALYAPGYAVTVPQGPRFSDPTRVGRDFAGISGGIMEAIIVPAPGSRPRFRTFSRGYNRIAHLPVSAYGGGIFAANPYQWMGLMHNIDIIAPEFVVITMDANPLAFALPMEFELFHLAMTDHFAQGRTVFVVSATGTETEITMRDGIRYIDLAEGTPEIQFWLGDYREIFWAD